MSWRRPKASGASRRRPKASRSVVLPKAFSFPEIPQCFPEPSGASRRRPKVFRSVPETSQSFPERPGYVSKLCQSVPETSHSRPELPRLPKLSKACRRCPKGVPVELLCANAAYTCTPAEKPKAPCANFDPSNFCQEHRARLQGVFPNHTCMLQYFAHHCAVAGQANNQNARMIINFAVTMLHVHMFNMEVYVQRLSRFEILWWVGPSCRQICHGH